MKMMNNKTSLALAVAAALGVMSPQTFAIVKIASDAVTKADAPEPAGSTIGGAVIFSTEEAREGVLGLRSFYSDNLTYYDGDLTAAIPVPPAYKVDSTKTLSVKVTLTGGATFVQEPYLVCLNSDIAAGSGSTTGLVANVATAQQPSVDVSAADALITTASSGGLSINVAGKATATFNLSPGLRTMADGTCLLSFKPPAAAGGSVTAYKIGAPGEVNINVEATYVQSNTAIKSTSAGMLLKFATALKSVIGPQTHDATFPDLIGTPTVSIDVKQASKNFEAKNQTTTTVAPLGSVYVTSGTTPMANVRLSNHTAASAVAANIMATATLKISGPLMAGVESVTLYPGDTTACGGTPSYAGVLGTGTSGGNVDVTVAGIPVDGAVAGLNICATVAGTKVLNAGQLTAVLTAGGMDGFIPDMGAEADLVNVGINGARLRVLNIPASTAPEIAFIRFYNTSSQNISVTGTLYGMDGKIIGTENSVLFPELKANDVEVLNAAALQAKVGATAPWTGRAWLMVQAEVDKDSFRVQALMRTPGVGGTLINMSTDVTN